MRYFTKFKETGNKICMSDDLRRCYLLIGGSAQKTEWGERRPVYLFDGFTGQSADSKKDAVAFRLYAIADKAPFNTACGAPTTHIEDAFGKTKKVTLTKVLHVLHDDKPLKMAGHIKAKLVDKSELTADRLPDKLTDEKEIDFWKEHYMYNFTRGNITGTLSGTKPHSAGCVFVEWPTMGVKWKGHPYYTEYSSTLAKLLHEVPIWWTDDTGALKAGCGKLGSPFSSIVAASCRGMIPDSAKTIKEKLDEIQNGIAGAGYEVDHMAERKENNYSFLLAMTNRHGNAVLTNRRTRIKRPYYWYNVYDHANDRCLVRYGNEETQADTYVVFGDLREEIHINDFLKCFNSFKDEAKKAGCFMKQPGEDSLLYYWADPARMSDRNNPLTQLLATPLDRFVRYKDVELYKELCNIERNIQQYSDFKDENNDSDPTTGKDTTLERDAVHTAETTEQQYQK